MPIAMPFIPGVRDFFIELAEPVLLLRGPPSEPNTNILRGEVELILTKPISASQVTISLIGKSNVTWPEGLGSLNSKICHEKTILDQNLILECRPAHDQTIPAGVNRWPFEFLIPNSIVETIEDEMAEVYYYVAAVVQRPGISSLNLRSRKNILILRTLSWSESSLSSHALPSTSIVAERKSSICDATIYIERSIVSSGTQFPISIVLTAQTKHVSLECINVTLSEKRIYQVPEYNARRSEMHDFKLKLTSVNDLADSEQMEQAMIPHSDIPLSQIRQAITAKNAHIPLGTSPFQYKFLFTLPNCSDMNHTTYFKEMNFLHHLKIDIEVSESSMSERTHLFLDTPITILDCRLKDDYNTLPTYQESLVDVIVNVEEHEDMVNNRAGFFMCPCYVNYKKKGKNTGGRERSLITRNNPVESPSSSPTLEDLNSLPPPPPYNK